MVSDQLKEKIENALNTAYLIIDEIRGGFAKQVYRVTTSDDIFILYIWQPPLDDKLTLNMGKFHLC